MISDWATIKSPPMPYLHAFRKTMASGLYVIVAIRAYRSGYAAYSILDHGTLQKTITLEAEGGDLTDIIRHGLKLCDGYGEARSMQTPDEPEKYAYIDMCGRIQQPVCRESLFRLIDGGVLNWESQIWDTMASHAGWESLNQAIGFAQIK